MKRTLDKPKLPEKEIRVDKNVDYSFPKYIDKVTSVKELLDWIEKTLPEGIADTAASIQLVEEWIYDDHTTHLRLSWSELVPNPNYDREMKKYERQLKKYEHQS